MASLSMTVWRQVLASSLTCLVFCYVSEGGRLQIQVRPEDRDVHRFLWDDGGTVRVMRFLHLPFGNKSSPFLMNATVKYHLSQCSPSTVVEELSENLYVDNFLSGCDEDSVGCEILQEANSVMERAGMTSQWASNSEQVGVVLNRDFHDRSAGEESLKVLGLRWQAADDFLCYDGVAVPEDLCMTKRVVLSFIARMFDPLGFLTPYVMIVKRLFQELWHLVLVGMRSSQRTLVSSFAAGLRVLIPSVSGRFHAAILVVVGVMHR